MSKKPKQSRHRIPRQALELKSDPIDDRYQAEVDRSIGRLEQRYRNAQRALAAAERRATNAATQLAGNTRNRALKTRHTHLLEIVEERRRELIELERLMNPVPSRDARRRLVRLEAGAIDVPLGATTGKSKPRRRVPIFPVETR